MSATSKPTIIVILSGMIIAVLASGCVTQAYFAGQERVKALDVAVKATVAAMQTGSMSEAASHPASPGSSSGSASSQGLIINVTGHSQEELGEADIRIVLTTGSNDGKLVFVGMEGDLEGMINPDILANPGDVIEIILENGDNVLHNIVLPDFSTQSEDVEKQGQRTSVKIKVNSEGIYPYYCSIPGHRLAGMEGKLIVGDPANFAGVAAADIARSPDDLPGPLRRTNAENVRIDLEAIEIEGRLADSAAYTFWTYNGKVPGPFLRIRSGDTVEVHLKNPATNTMEHSVDFHAVTGPGGGAASTHTNPGQETMFTFKALNPGVYVYHCASAMIPHHISNGMYGLILVEPEDGLPAVDREFYAMQGEIYTQEPYGSVGRLTFSEAKLLDEAPEYFIVNGSVGALTALHPLQANVGETVRIYYGVGGPNFTSAFHVIGEIFDRVYDQASITSPALSDVQTTLVPPGGATVVEFKLDVPGRYILVDHALSRLQRGLAGFLEVEGAQNPEIYQGMPTGSGDH